MWSPLTRIGLDHDAVGMEMLGAIEHCREVGGGIVARAIALRIMNGCVAKRACSG
jgi:hypothetical protein